MPALTYFDGRQIFRLYVPPDQPEYIADGLLVRADEIQHQPVDHDDD